MQVSNTEFVGQFKPVVTNQQWSELSWLHYFWEWSQDKVGL